MVINDFIFCNQYELNKLSFYFMVVFVTTSFWALAGAASAYSCGYFGLEVSCGFSVMFDRSRPVQRLKYQAFL